MSNGGRHGATSEGPQIVLPPQASYLAAQGLLGINLGRFRNRQRIISRVTTSTAIKNIFYTNHYGETMLSVYSDIQGEKGFVAVFSANYFPNAQIVLEWAREDGGGN